MGGGAEDLACRVRHRVRGRRRRRQRRHLARGRPGRQSIRLTDNPAHDRSPAWFPDGSAIVFASERGGASGLWKVPRLGGQSPTPIVAAAGSPAISPDGTRIAFTRPDAGGTLRIAVAPLANPSAAKVLTTANDGLWNHASPAWSPDGQTICYAAQTNLWVVPAEGGKPRRLTKDGEADFEPAWSADGRWVSFTSMRGQTTAIWRVPVGGGAPERVTMGSGPRAAAQPVDGRREARVLDLQPEQQPGGARRANGAGSRVRRRAPPISTRRSRPTVRPWCTCRTR